MRKIEVAMLLALHTKQQLVTPNTHVVRHAGWSEVRLFGNRIAEIYDNGIVRMSLAGWNTSTTRSRLNAIAREFGTPGFSTREGMPHFNNEKTDAHKWNVHYGKEK